MMMTDQQYGLRAYLEATVDMPWLSRRLRQGERSLLSMHIRESELKSLDRQRFHLVTVLRPRRDRSGYHKYSFVLSACPA